MTLQNVFFCKNGLFLDVLQGVHAIMLPIDAKFLVVSDKKVAGAATMNVVVMDNWEGAKIKNTL